MARAGIDQQSERITDLSKRLTAARAAVFVAAQALHHGETDLELHAAELLQPAAESLDDVVSELLTL